MNRLTRITAILIQLQSKKIVTASEIAGRFEISLRTVYRDIKTLQESGVPIGSENGTDILLLKDIHYTNNDYSRRNKCSNCFRKINSKPRRHFLD